MHLPSLKLKRKSCACWYAQSKLFTISEEKVMDKISLKAVIINAPIFMPKIAGKICGNLLFVLNGPWIAKVVRIIMWTSLKTGTAQMIWGRFLETL